MAKSNTNSKVLRIVIAAAKPSVVYTTVDGKRTPDPARNGWSIDAAKAAGPVIEAVLKKLADDHKATQVEVIAMAMAGPEMGALAAALRLKAAGEPFEAVILQPYGHKVGTRKSGGPEIHWDEQTQARYQALLARAKTETFAPRVADDKEADQAVMGAARRLAGGADVVLACLVDGSDLGRVAATVAFAAAQGARVHDLTMDLDAYYPAPVPSAAPVAKAAEVELW